MTSASDSSLGGGCLLDCGACRREITPGNTNDRKPVANLLAGLFGKVLADRGDVSKALATELRENWGIEFFAKPRRHRKNHLMRLNDKLLSRKCVILETVIDQLKNMSQIVRKACRRQTLPSSQPGQLLLQHYLRSDCLLSPAQKARYPSRVDSSPVRLTRADIMLAEAFTTARYSTA
jgi:hypothetical protein